MESVKANGFKVNSSLAYLIQQVTKDSTQEILAYLYGVAAFVADEVYKKSKAGYTNKDIILFYKDTPITFRIKMYIGGIQRDNGDRKYWNASVGYPSQTDDKDITELMNTVVETGLGLTTEEELPKFERPMLKTPACLRKVRIAQDEQRAAKSE